MLTFSAILKATRQLTSYGDERNGALGHLPKRIKGPYPERRRHDDAVEAARGDTVRRWDDDQGKFVYVKIE